MSLSSLLPTWIASAFDIAPPGQNILYIAITNRNAGRVIRVRQVNFYVSSEVAVAGVLIVARLGKRTGQTIAFAGTAITPIQMDTNDSIAFNGADNIDVLRLPTGGNGARTEFKNIILSSDEAVVTTLDADAYSSELFPRDTSALIKFENTLKKPLVLRTDGTTFQGCEIVHVAPAGAVGNVGVEILFTVSDT